MPQATRIGVLWSPTAPSHRPALQAVGDCRRKSSGFSSSWYRCEPSRISTGHSRRWRENVSAVFSSWRRRSLSSHRARLAELALKHRLPGMFGTKENVEAGGLMSYGADLNEWYRRAATYIDKILKGAKPADLPVEQASKYQLVINLKTAKALGLTIPPILLARADEVIE